MKLRTTFTAMLAATALTLTACGNGEEGSANGTAEDTTATDSTAASSSETITIEDNHGTQEIPADAQRVAVLDNRAFEILDQWGITPVAAPVPLVPFTIEGYEDNPDIADIGNHREPDLEALTAAQPELIVSGQRFTSYYEDIAALNPDAAIIELEPREGEPLDEELRRHTEALGKAFGKESEAQSLIDDFDAALARAQEAYDSSQSVMAVNVSGGTIGYIAPSVGRTFGPLFDLIGLTPALEIEDGTNDHQGDDISVEAIAQSNPDLLLVLDRDGGTSTRNTSDYIPAEQVISDSPALGGVTAIAEDNVYYAPADTYTNESIITYTEILNGLADLFESASN